MGQSICVFSIIFLKFEAMSAFKTWTDYHHKLNLIFHAIVAVTMLPFVWLFLEIDSNGQTGVISDIASIVLFALVSLSLTGAAYIYKKKCLEEIGRKSDLRAKLEAYLKILVVNYALLEGGALFATLAFYLTASYVFVVVYLFILLVFSLSRPNLDRTCRELYLNKEERALLIDLKEIPAH